MLNEGQFSIQENLVTITLNEFDAKLLAQACNLATQKMMGKDDEQEASAVRAWGVAFQAAGAAIDNWYQVQEAEDYGFQMEAEAGLEPQTVWE